MNNHRLGYQRLAEALVERGLVEPQAVQDALSMANKGGMPFPEALVHANLVADWELSRVVCQLYSLPFLTTEMAAPDPEAMQGLDVDFLFENGIVPLCRHGQLLTLCMPAIVPAEILGCISAESDLLVEVVVGTVNSNRRWITQAEKASQAEQAKSLALAGDDSEWGSLFDEADAAVLSDLEVVGLEEGADTNLEMLGLEDLADISGLDQLTDAIEHTLDLEHSLEAESGGPASLPPPLKRLSKRKTKSDDEPQV